MSAPSTRDPLAVTTTDGASWVRRAVTSEGRGLYAVDGACKCPPYLMATLAELAEHGIAGSADVLPVPVGPGPQALSDAAELAAFRMLDLGDLDGRRSACCGKPTHLTWLRKLDDTRACPWCVMDLQSESLVARTHQLAHYQGIERNFWANQRADQSLAAVAHRRIAELNQERDALQARVAELEAERHSTNEALDDAVRQLRARPVPDADRLTRMLASTQVLREDEPAETPPLTIYRASHESIVMGLYTTAAAAREHCETVLRRETSSGTLGWVPDHGGGDAPEELSAFGPGGDDEGPDETCTGYVVTPLQVASEYDAEADE